MAWPEANDLLGHLVVQLLTGPYLTSLDRTACWRSMTSSASPLALVAFEFPSLNDDQVTRRVGTAWAGGPGARADIPEPSDGERIAVGDVMAAPWSSPLPGSPAPPTAGRAGYATPAAGRFAHSTATELSIGTDLDDSQRCEPRSKCGTADAIPRDLADTTRHIHRR